MTKKSKKGPIKCPKCGSIMSRIWHLSTDMLCNKCGFQINGVEFYNCCNANCSVCKRYRVDTIYGGDPSCDAGIECEDFEDHFTGKKRGCRHFRNYDKTKEEFEESLEELKEISDKRG